MTEEQQLLDMIAMIQRDYKKQIQPYVNRLVLLRSRQPPPPIFVSNEDAEYLRRLVINDLGMKEI
jgi:hypothetical protein